MIAPWYAVIYIKLERIAWRHGYALAVHGSMSRDLDLIAVPWVEDADIPDKLIQSFVRFIIKHTGVKMRTPKPALMEHGRLAYTVPFESGRYYLDVSVIQPDIKKGGEK